MNNKSESNPRRDWHVLLVVFTILFVLILGGYFILERSINNELITSAKEATPAVPNLNRQKLSAIAQIIAERQALLETLLAAPKEFSDPSL